MRLLHPIEPFISEEIWLALPHDGQSIMTSTWPDPLEVPQDGEAAADFDALRAAVERARNLRAKLRYQPKERIPLRVPLNVAEQAGPLLAQLATADVEVSESKGASLREAVTWIQPVVPNQVLLERYREDTDRLRAEVQRLEQKLGNVQFVAKAAPDVVAKERDKLEKYRRELTDADSQLADVESAMAARGESGS
jgi:valyl-tRNA synthetase